MKQRSPAQPLYRSIALSLFRFTALLLLASMLAPTPARARSVVVLSDPVDGAVLQQAPAMVDFWFDSAAIIEPGAVHLSDAEGNELALPGFHSDIYKPNDAGLQGRFDPTYLFLCSLGLNSYPTKLMVHLPALGPGTYRLSWRAIAISDKQASSGSLVFAIDPSAPPAAGDDGMTFSTTTIADDLMVTLAIRPNRPGANFISLQAAPIRRPLRAPIGQMTVRLTAPDGTPREVVLAATAEGSYQIAGELIDRPGNWTAQILAARGPLPATAAILSWEVPADNTWGPLLWASLGLAGLALAAAGGLYLRRRQA